MRPEERDAAYLWDMLDAARAIQGFVAGVRADDYARNRQLQFAVERALEIIGEAARRVSDSLRGAHPEIPWQPIIGQRNMLAHEYGEIRQERIWLVATRHIPELIRSLEPLVPPDADNDMIM
jgi:uncharacterized protein with HEPN domain